MSDYKYCFWFLFGRVFFCWLVVWYKNVMCVSLDLGIKTKLYGNSIILLYSFFFLVYVIQKQKQKYCNILAVCLDCLSTSTFVKKKKIERIFFSFVLSSSSNFILFFFCFCQFIRKFFTS